MVRRYLLIVALLLLTALPAVAQSEARVAVRLFPDTAAGPHARVRVMSLLDDPTWRDAVKSSFPVRLEWTVQLWPTGIFAKAGPKVEWRDMIQWNSILKVYQLTSSIPGEAPQNFSSLEMLALQIGRPQELEEFGPQSSGNWYYRVTLKLSTLTEDEMEKLSSSQQRLDQPGSVQQWLNKVLLNATLPTKTLTEKSPVFHWR